MRPKFITFTGLDARTDMDRVVEISRAYPVEWGVLFSPKRQGWDPRYPDLDLVHVLKREYADSLSLSAHLCGRYAARVQGSLPVKLDLKGFRRAQINCTIPDVGRITEWSHKAGLRAIAQWRTLRFPEEDSIDWLYDRSGGTGEVPKSWPIHPEDGRMVGYAGGMGPDNAGELVEAIKCRHDYWIDMETKVRTNDWLDLDKCEAVCRSIFD